MSIVGPNTLPFAHIGSSTVPHTFLKRSDSSTNTSIYIMGIALL